MRRLLCLTTFLLLSCSKLFKDLPHTSSFVNRIVVQTENLNKLNDLVQREKLAVKVLDDEDKIYALSGNIDGQKVLALVKEIEKVEGVQFAEPAYKVKSLVIKESSPPKDRFWPFLWAFKNYGQDIFNLGGREDADISLLKAWTITKGSKDIVVAVLDTGISYLHPDLKDNIWINEAEKSAQPSSDPSDGIDNDNNDYVDDIYGWNSVSNELTKKHYGKLGSTDPADDDGHGTHCAGIIAAQNDTKGVVGVAPGVRVMAIKALSDGGGSVDDIYQGFLYAIKNKVDIINASFGNANESKLLKLAIKKASDAKIIVVAAAGNDGQNNDVDKHFPSNYDLENIVSVAATNNRDRLASFSNFGAESVDLAAPGVDVLSTFPQGYALLSGTSMAAPMVSGALALLLSHRPDLRKNPAAAIKVLLNNVDVQDSLIGKVKSGGRLNVYKMLMDSEKGKGLIDQEWIEESYSLSTPESPDVRFDQIWSVKKDGAKFIQAHINYGYIDKFDALRIFAADYSLVGEVKGEVGDLWLPVVKGDQFFLLFSNAIVQIDSQKEIFPNMSSRGIFIDKIRYIPDQLKNSERSAGDQDESK